MVMMLMLAEKVMVLMKIMMMIIIMIIIIIIILNLKSRLVSGNHGLIWIYYTSSNRIQQMN